MFKCQNCKSSFENQDSLIRHCSRKHKIKPEEYYLKYISNGIKGTCKCGCGETTGFMNGLQGYHEYIRGHISRIHNNWGHNQNALDKSHETCKQMRKNGELKQWNDGLSLDDDRIKKSIDLLHKINNTIDGKKRMAKTMKEGRLNGTIPTLYGTSHSQWKGGYSPLNAYCHGNRKLYSEWKYPILKEGNFKCSVCQKFGGGKIILNVHHDKERMADIIHRIADECGWKGYYTTQREAPEGLKAEISNRVAEYHISNKVSGKILCEECHKLEHENLNLSEKN